MNRRSKTRLVSSIAIFISGYTPLFLIMIIKDIKSFFWYEKILDTPILFVSKIKFPYWINFSNKDVVFTLIGLSVVSLILLRYVLKNITKDPFDITINSAKCRSSEVVNYTIPYMISFVAFDLSKWQDIFSLVLFLSVLCLLSIRSQSVFINPILAAMGYGLYDCSYKEGDENKECVMLSTKDLLANTEEKFVKLNNYMGIISK
ncbi:hypothetical protein [Photobacterium sp. DNB22_13_2]